MNRADLVKVLEPVKSALVINIVSMKICSYLERRSRFKYDLVKLHVSLKLRPRNWHVIGRDFNGLGHAACLYNRPENMELWIANDVWGLHFIVKGRYYGGAAIFGRLFKWRRNLFKLGLEASASPWVFDATERYKK